MRKWLARVATGLMQRVKPSPEKLPELWEAKVQEVAREIHADTQRLYDQVRANNETRDALLRHAQDLYQRNVFLTRIAERGDKLALAVFNQKGAA